VQALADLWIYLIVGFILAFALCLRAMVQATQIIVKKLLGPFGFVGDVLGDGFAAIAAPITHALDVVINNLEAFVGWSLHVQAQLVRWLAGYLEYGAMVALQLGHHVSGKAGVSDLARMQRAFTHAFHAISAAGAHALHGVIVINQKADAALRHAVLPRVGRLEHEVAGTIEHTIPSLRHRDRTLEDEYARLNRLIRSHPWTAVTTAFVGAVSIALARLGAGWVRCDNNQRLGRAVCGMDTNLLEDLLGLAVLGFAIADYQDLVKLAQAEMDTAVGIVEELLQV
jgi:hypothetical protein